MDDDRPVLADRLPIRGAQPRILIVRLSALGDVVFATSLLDTLRARWPQAHIAWLVQQNFAGILESEVEPGGRLDERITVPPDIYRSWRALRDLRRRLANRQFDWVLDAQGLLKSRVLARLAPGAVRIGFDSKEPGTFLLDHRLSKGGDPRDIASEYRYFASQLTGADSSAPRLPVQKLHADTVEAAMRGTGLQPGFIALCPFTTRPQKHWFEEHWASTARLLYAASGGARRCVIFGGPADRTAAARMMREMPPGTVDLSGHTRLADVPAWLAQAGAVIGVDTGLTHIGIAVRRPVVALFGSTRPYTQGAPSPLAVLYEDLPCAPCKRRPTCNGAWTCMRQLDPQRVAAATLALLTTKAA